ncbi:hypothetical protein [Bifidobacterium aemilianum]|nr:hypothetical protein [Bifidobacterium aemilianum]
MGSVLQFFKDNWENICKTAAVVLPAVTAILGFVKFLRQESGIPGFHLKITTSALIKQSNLLDEQQGKTTDDLLRHEINARKNACNRKLARRRFIRLLGNWRVNDQIGNERVSQVGCLVTWCVAVWPASAVMCIVLFTMSNKGIRGFFTQLLCVYADLLGMILFILICTNICCYCRRRMGFKVFVDPVFLQNELPVGIEHEIEKGMKAFKEVYDNADLRKKSYIASAIFAAPSIAVSVAGVLLVLIFFPGSSPYHLDSGFLNLAIGLILLAVFLLIPYWISYKRYVRQIVSLQNEARKQMSWYIPERDDIKQSRRFRRIRKALRRISHRFSERRGSEDTMADAGHATHDEDEKPNDL